MNQLDDRVRFLFEAHIAETMASIDSLSLLIAQASQNLVNCLLSDGKILVCGNGGSFANALHFSSALLNTFEVERPALPVITLGLDGSLVTAVVGDNHADQIFSRQIQALGQENDILIIIATSENAPNIVHAINSAHEKNMQIIALTGQNNGLLASVLKETDLDLRIMSESMARISETHLFILHCFCDLIEQCLFGQISSSYES
jgi:D-sedoheptulose 7-phosphate isomerase